jgi:methionyl aminopeptidase
MIVIKSPSEIEIMRKSARVSAKIIDALERMIAPGLKTIELDKRAAEVIAQEKAHAAFKGYNGYPAHICVSVNEEVVHGIPGERILKEGDIVSLDVGVQIDGYFGDMARTFAVGEVDADKERLIETTRRALHDAVEMTRVDKRLFDISHAIETCAERGGFSVVRDYVGHGIGTRLHEDPQIPNFGRPGTGPRLKRGMVFALEAMVNMGSYHVELLSDGWTAVTQDRCPSAHFEDMVVVTEAGPEVLTCRETKSP